MKPSLFAMVPVLLVLAAGPAPLEGAAPSAAPVPWDEQNRAMGYLILHLSNINVVNGLNLSRDQAVALRDVARQVQATSPALPDLTGPYRPDLAEVRDAYLEVRRRLLAGEEIDDALRQRVARARTTESAVVRLSITAPDAARAGCAHCHQAPEAPDVRTLGADAYRGGVQQVARDPADRKAVFVAHSEGLLGKRGLVTVALLAGKVDGILTGAQKAGLAEFSCCIIPPKDMSDPSRIGQAESGEQTVEHLRQAREIPDALWPAVRRMILERAEALTVAVAPGADQDRKQAVRDRVGDVYDRARAAGDVDFEIDKHALAAELADLLRPETPQGDNQRRFMAAYFLTVPGAVEAYDRLIERLDAQAAAPTGP
ncbi:MAG: hypothetical protein ISS74_07760 [Planctomycetes bacterium]|nr:hypothetical protein [Planctomycetota bacterium]